MSAEDQIKIQISSIFVANELDPYKLRAICSFYQTITMNAIFRAKNNKDAMKITELMSCWDSLQFFFYTAFTCLKMHCMTTN